MFVRDWMSTPAVTIQARMPAPVALEFMQKHRIRRLPVVEEGTLVGIVTRSDLEAELGRQKDRASSKKKVSDVMTPGPFTVSPDETFEGAAMLMLRQKISGLPVVKDEKVVGMLTESDIFRALAAMLGIAEHGPRITMRIGDESDLLEEIRRRLGQLKIRSLVTLHNPRARRWDVAVRVRGRLPGKV